jgi:DNA-binding MarR family transcriptional regulator
VVVFGGPVTLGQLARAEQVRPPTMTKIVTGLERDRLVERRPDPNDGRLTRIVATPKGQRILIEGRARRVKSLTAAVGKLSKSELAQLDHGIQVFQKLIAHTAQKSPADAKS